VDVVEGADRSALCAIAFRGILSVDSRLMFRPDDAITRGEFASALARSAHLNAAPLGMAIPTDVETESFEGEECARILAVGWLKPAASGRFESNAKVTREEVCSALIRLIERSGPLRREQSLSVVEELSRSKSEAVTRREVASGLHTILRLPK
jgi:hypothetical protein